MTEFSMSHFNSTCAEIFNTIREIKKSLARQDIQQGLVPWFNEFTGETTEEGLKNGLSRDTVVPHGDTHTSSTDHDVAGAFVDVAAHHGSMDAYPFDPICLESPEFEPKGVEFAEKETVIEMSVACNGMSFDVEETSDSILRPSEIRFGLKSDAVVTTIDRLFFVLQPKVTVDLYEIFSYLLDSKVAVVDWNGERNCESLFGVVKNIFTSRLPPVCENDSVKVLSVFVTKIWGCIQPFVIATKPPPKPPEASLNMLGQTNQVLTIVSKISCDMFKSMVRFTGSSKKDATTTKCLVFDGLFISVYVVELTRSQLALTECVKSNVFAQLVVVVFAEFIDGYDTHNSRGLKKGDKDEISYYVRHEDDDQWLSAIFMRSESKLLQFIRAKRAWKVILWHQQGARARILQGSCCIRPFDEVFSNFDYMKKEHKPSENSTIIIGSFNIMVIEYCARSDIKKFMETAIRANLNMIGQSGVESYFVYFVGENVIVTTKHNVEEQYVWVFHVSGSFTMARDISCENLDRRIKIILFIKVDQHQQEFLVERELEDLIKHSELIGAYNRMCMTNLGSYYHDKRLDFGHNDDLYGDIGVSSLCGVFGYGKPAAIKGIVILWKVKKVHVAYHGSSLVVVSDVGTSVKIKVDSCEGRGYRVWISYTVLGLQIWSKNENFKESLMANLQASHSIAWSASYKFPSTIKPQSSIHIWNLLIHLCGHFSPLITKLGSEKMVTLSAMSVASSLTTSGSKRMQAGDSKFADFGGVTYDLKRWNVFLHSEDMSSTLVAEDGLTTVQEVLLKDSLENIRAKLARQTATETNNLAGNVTIIIVILIGGLITDGVNVVAVSANRVLIVRRIENMTKALVAKLGLIFKKVDSELADVAAVSASNKYKVGNMIEEVMPMVGCKGVLTLAFSMHCTKKFVMFSLPRPPEIANLEDKVDFKGVGMIRAWKVK